MSDLSIKEKWLVLHIKQLKDKVEGLEAHLQLAGILATEVDQFLRTPIHEASAKELDKALMNYNKSIFSNIHSDPEDKS